MCEMSNDNKIYYKKIFFDIPISKTAKPISFKFGVLNNIN